MGTLFSLVAKGLQDKGKCANITHHQREGDCHNEGTDSHSSQANQVQCPSSCPFNQEELELQQEKDC